MTAIPSSVSHASAEPHDDAGGSSAHDHPEFLAHHWATPEQQFQAGLLGMWLFVATEVLLFAGLFCAYAVVRHNHPAIFQYGSQFLDTKLGALNTAILILSSLTMALGVNAAQLGRRWTLLALLGATFLGGAGFMVVKYFEYSHKIHENLVWGTKFYEPTAHGHDASVAVHDALPSEEEHGPDLAHGRAIWEATCRSCHGLTGEGVAGQGKDIRGSSFILDQSDQDLLAFVKVGRMPFDPLNTTGIQMPPRGGNPLLKDGDLRDAIAHLRTLVSADFTPPAEGDGDVEVAGAAPATEEAFWIAPSSIPLAADAPPGLHEAYLAGTPTNHHAPPSPDRARDPDRPANAHLFFGIYFCMTGLHGIHVLIGMTVMAWLMVRTVRGDFSPAYYTPIDLGGLYWHVVDLIWIFLFPLLYLI